MNRKILLCISLILLILLCGCSKNKTSYSENLYSEYLSNVYCSSTYMPSIKDLGNYNLFEITYKSTNGVLFSKTDTIGVFLNYDSDNYLIQKDYIYSKYSFLNNIIDNRLNDYQASINGYKIFIVNNLEEYNFDNEKYYYIPKSFLMIGINDEENKICYLYQYDSELDTIKNLDKHIKKYFILQ